MSTVRLTNEIREEITTAMLRHRFGKELTKLMADRAALAESIYNDLYKAADRKRIADLPEGWLPTAHEIKFSASGQFTSIPFNGGFYGALNLSLPEKSDHISKPFASKHCRACVSVYDGAHKLAVRYSEIQSRFSEIAASHDAASHTVKAALNKASTTGRLKELWPEAAPFCLPYEGRVPSLPSVPTSALNQLLDLPVSEAA